MYIYVYILCAYVHIVYAYVRMRTYMQTYASTQWICTHTHIVTHVRMYSL